MVVPEVAVAEEAEVLLEASDKKKTPNKKTAITLIEENVLPLFNNLRPDYKERYKFIPEHRFIGNKCELLY